MLVVIPQVPFGRLGALLSALIVVLALSMPLIQKKLATIRKGGERG